MTDLQVQTGQIYSVVVRLHPLEVGWLYLGSGTYAHAAFLDIVRQHDPALAEELHQPNRRRPFTVSLFQLPRPVTIARSGSKVPVKPSEVYWLRFSMLDDEVFSSFARHFISGWKSARLRIGETHFEVSRLLIAPEQGSPFTSWAAHSSFEELSQGATGQTRYSFEFASPTAFSQGQQDWGKKFKLLPEASLLFDSLARQWDSFAPAALQLGSSARSEFVQWCEDYLVTGQLQLETQTLYFKNFPQVGFTGRVTYECKASSNPWAVWVSRLAAFALYAGVGYKTTMGMGQVRCVGMANQLPAKGSGQLAEPKLRSIQQEDHPTEVLV